MIIETTASVYTLGCRVNQYESEAVAAFLRSRGVDAATAEVPGDIRDIYILNTCAVTAESSAKSRKLLRRLRRINPHAVIAAVGCDGQLEPEALVKSGADIVAGSRVKLEAAARAVLLAEQKSGEAAGTGNVFGGPAVDVRPLDKLPIEPMKIDGFGRTRAYIKIQDGCNGNCSYCIIPSLRGGVSSRTQDEVIAEVIAVAAAGCREIVLTGIETSAYQYDLPGLALKICDVDGIERVRLSSLDPSYLKPEVIVKFGSIPKLMPHYHLSLQSGSDQVLSSMRRKYNARQAMDNIEKLKQVIPGAKLTADILTCFPGESESDFEETLAFARQADFYHMHIFTYSPRPGTEASLLPELDRNIRLRRSAILRELNVRLRTEHHRRAVALGGQVEILFEQTSGGLITGHTKDFIEAAVVAAPGIAAEELRGKIACAHPVNATEKYLVCKLD